MAAAVTLSRPELQIIPSVAVPTTPKEIVNPIPRTPEDTRIRVPLNVGTKASVTVIDTGAAQSSISQEVADYCQENGIVRQPALDHGCATLADGITQETPIETATSTVEAGKVEKEEEVDKPVETVEEKEETVAEKGKPVEIAEGKEQTVTEKENSAEKQADTIQEVKENPVVADQSRTKLEQMEERDGSESSSNHDDNTAVDSTKERETGIENCETTEVTDKDDVKETNESEMKEEKSDDKPPEPMTNSGKTGKTITTERTETGKVEETPILAMLTRNEAPYLQMVPVPAFATTTTIPIAKIPFWDLLFSGDGTSSGNTTPRMKTTSSPTGVRRTFPKSTQWRPSGSHGCGSPSNPDPRVR